MFLVLGAILLLKHPDQMVDLIVHGKTTLQETTRHHCHELQLCDITCIVHCMIIVTNSNFFNKQTFFNRRVWTFMDQLASTNSYGSRRQTFQFQLNEVKHRV